MTDLASWPIITLPTASMCARQWASASMLAPIAISSISRSCDRIPRWRVASEATYPRRSPAAGARAQYVLDPHRLQRVEERRDRADRLARVPAA